MPVLTELSFALKKSGTLAVLGANGSGKTTLLHLLALLLQEDKGSVLLENRPIREIPEHEFRSRVGLLMQNSSNQLFAPTVFEDVAFGPSRLNPDEEDLRTTVEKTLAELGIEALSDMPIHALSAGQRQRVALAGIFAMNPEVLLLDEPSGGLDPLAEETFFSILKQKAQQGCAVIYTTHQIPQAESFSDYILLLHQGRQLAFGPSEQIMSQPELFVQAGLQRPR